jgi:hypothetical protein
VIGYWLLGGAAFWWLVGSFAHALDAWENSSATLDALAKEYDEEPPL